MTPWAEQIQVLREVLRSFEGQGIAYAIGGSIASSVYGIPRFTRGADVSVAPFPGKEEALAASLGSAYYVSTAAMRQANTQRRSFNIIQPSLGFKVDCFVLGTRPFDRDLLERCAQISFDEAPDQPLFVVSPEDILLLKLEWYRKGGEIRDQQWSDVLGIMRAQADALDHAYLDEIASELKIADLLGKARIAAGPTD
jgi:hypothetical protein